MSITVVKEKAATVITEAKSMFPPLCQNLKALCCSPVSCWANRGLMQSPVIGAFGAVEIMMGLFNIGLGPGRTRMHPEDFTDLKAAYWLGAVYIIAGCVSVCADRFPSRRLVGFAVFVNIVSTIFAIVGIVLYALDLGDASLRRMCDEKNYNDTNCEFVAHYAQRLMTGMDVTLIVLTALQLCVCISLAVLGINTLLNKGKGAPGGENYQPLLKEVLMTSPGA